MQGSIAADLTHLRKMQGGHQRGSWSVVGLVCIREYETPRPEMHYPGPLGLHGVSLMLG